VPGVTNIGPELRGVLPGIRPDIENKIEREFPREPGQINIARDETETRLANNPNSAPTKQAVQGITHLHQEPSHGHVHTDAPDHAVRRINIEML
jgi:hypothetical protein